VGRDVQLNVIPERIDGGRECVEPLSDRFATNENYTERSVCLLLVRPSVLPQIERNSRGDYLDPSRTSPRMCTNIFSGIIRPRNKNIASLVCVVLQPHSDASLGDAARIIIVDERNLAAEICMKRTVYAPHLGRVKYNCIEAAGKEQAA
jgi:hypothetical protein